MSNSILRNPRPRAIDSRAALRSLIAALAALIALACATPAGAEQGFSVTRVEERTFPLVKSPNRRDFVNQPFFDAAGTLRWDGGSVAEGGSRCDAAETGVNWSTPPRCRLEVLVAAPRVERCRCEGEIDGQPAAREIFSGAGERRWRRVRCEKKEAACEYLASAGAESLIFSGYEVWSPATGATVRPADRQLKYPHLHTLFLPERSAFFEFSAQMTLLASKGGYYLTDAAAGKSELIKRVETGPLGYWTPEEMQRLPGTSLVAIVERWSTRGPGERRLVLFDLDRREQVYTEKLWRACICGDEHIVFGPAGRLAVSFFDDTQYRLIEYRIDPTQPGRPVAPARPNDGVF